MILGVAAILIDSSVALLKRNSFNRRHFPCQCATQFAKDRSCICKSAPLPSRRRSQSQSPKSLLVQFDATKGKFEAMRSQNQPEGFWFEVGEALWCVEKAQLPPPIRDKGRILAISLSIGPVLASNHIVSLYRVSMLIEGTGGNHPPAQAQDAITSDARAVTATPISVMLRDWSRVSCKRFPMPQGFLMCAKREGTCCAVQATTLMQCAHPTRQLPLRHRAWSSARGSRDGFQCLLYLRPIKPFRHLLRPPHTALCLQ